MGQAQPKVQAASTSGGVIGAASKSRQPGSLFRITLAAFIALSALILYGRPRIIADQFALGSETVSRIEYWRGRPINAASVPDTLTLLKSKPDTFSKSVLWLGFSQLHAINQYKDGDHLAPYLLIKNLNCNDCLLPLGISLPNANFQEYYLLANYIAKRMQLSGVILTLPFDKLREDGLRDELAPLLTPDARADLFGTDIGREMVTIWDARHASMSDVDPLSAPNGSDTHPRPTRQQVVEEVLSSAIGRACSLWADRGSLRSALFEDLYFFRNWILHIKPNSIRKIIRPRYDRNMKALQALISEMKRQNIPMLAYIAPVRSDVPSLYDQTEYQTWKAQVAAMLQREHVRLLNLESLVPGQHWGTTNGDWIDFMHFQGHGHELLAQALVEPVKELVERREPDAVQ